MRRLLRTNSMTALLVLPVFWCVLVLWFCWGGRYADATDACGILPPYEFPESVWWGAAAVLAIALFFFFQNERYRFLRQTSALPAFLYILSVARIVPSFGLNSSLIAACVLAMLVYSVDGAAVRQNDNSPVFCIGFFALFAAAFHLKLVLLLPWSLLLLALVGRFTLRDMAALAIGWCAAAFFACFILFWTDNMETPAKQLEFLLNDRHTVGIASFTEWFRLGLLSVLSLVFVISSVTVYVAHMYVLRRTVSAYVSLFAVLAISAVAFYGVSQDFVYIVSVPMAWIMSYYAFEYKSGTGSLLFFMYAAASLYPVS